MNKVKFKKIFGILPGLFIFIIALILWFLVNGKQKLILLPTLLLTLLLFIYYLTFYYSNEIFEFGKSKLINNEKILQLEKDNVVYNLAWINGIGIFFLIPGLDKLPTSPILALSGFILIIVGNVLYNMEYLPRYFLLKINADLNYELERRRRRGG
jgi:hypothetical protein